LRSPPLCAHSPFIISKRIKIFALVTAPALLAVGLGVCVGEDSAAQIGTNWVSLFNGRDLAGWVPMNDGIFSVTNGNLRASKGNGWLRTTNTYRDFVFETEWQALETNYNSGFFVRAEQDGKPWPNDVWQINLRNTALGALLKGSTTLVPATTPEMPLEKWVKFRIEVRGKHISLDVDGKRAWESDQLDDGRGFIGIQAEGKTLDFRNLRLQGL
jgi:hypothetical protein